MKEEEALQRLREKIDKLDYKIHDLMNDRAKLALEVSAVKIRYHGKNTEFYRPEREKIIIDKIKSHNQGPLDENAIANIFEKIIQSCRELQIQTHRSS